jgi:hypothetical protein
MENSNWIAEISEHNKAATACRGLYYNFKKGEEYCPNINRCRYYSAFEEHCEKTGNTWGYGVSVLRFPYINYFRKCKRYENN